MAVDMVLSVLAGDRPGLVEVLSKAVADVDGNWIDSSMARLGGEFAGIVRVSISEEAVDTFEQTVIALAADGITVQVRRGGETVVEPSGYSAKIELTGADHPGIVHEISRTLAAHGVSIDDLQTEVFTGSMSGGQLFSAHARIIVPDSLNIDDLLAELERTASDIMVEIELIDAEALASKG